MNHMLTSMLSSVSMQYNDELLSQLVVEVLTVCPDQLVWFLPSLRSSLQPRSSPAWLRAMGLLQQVSLLSATLSSSLAIINIYSSIIYLYS